MTVCILVRSSHKEKNPLYSKTKRSSFRAVNTATATNIKNQPRHYTILCAKNEVMLGLQLELIKNVGRNDSKRAIVLRISTCRKPRYKPI